MPTTGNIYADWYSASPRTHAFWASFAYRYTHFCRPPFTEIGWSFVAYTAYQLFSHNMKYQVLLYGTYDNEHYEPVAQASFLGPDPSTPLDNLNTVQCFGQFDEIPPNALDYPRAKTNARKTYWTGISRRRRNL